MTLTEAVLGHCEWVDFARVERLPRAGEIVHAREAWREPGGGGGIVAIYLGARLFTAAGPDGLAEALMARGVTVHAARRDASRRIVTHLDDAGERTITTLGDRVEPRGDDDLPWDLLGDTVLVTAGDAGALRHARAARTVVATPRTGEVLDTIETDVLVWSANDPHECALADGVSRARVRVETRGAEGGTWTAADGTHGGWTATAPPGDPVDQFGCGDAFAAGLTAGLGRGERLEDALARGARAGAAALTGRGPYGALDAITRTLR